MKRGQSGACCVVGIDKPQGASSHDVVNAVRRAFGERRVGHTGTLDPAATGALAVCVGPATRLDAFLVGHGKTYDARIAFGLSTDTDDAIGAPLCEAEVPQEVSDAAFAQSFLRGIEGVQMQMPPAYSAIKRNGVKAYEAARVGREVALEPREVNIEKACLLGVSHDAATGRIVWDVRFDVSKGTYIRSIARDVGQALGTQAHLAALRRVRCGFLDVTSCFTLEEVEKRTSACACDPVRLLGFPVGHLSSEQAADVRNGKALPLARLHLEAPSGTQSATAHDDTSDANEASISLVFGNELRAIYTPAGKEGIISPRCVFSQGVIRGTNL